jgi:hypothetical protein
VRILRLLFVLCVLAVGTIPAWAQDLVSIAPQAAKVEFENAQVRVVRLKLAPNESLPMHDRPARVVIPLTTNNVRITRADGTAAIVQSPAGKAAWSEPARRSVMSLDAPLENIVIELKQARAPAKALSGPPTPRPQNYLEEPLHPWQFENQYVRVYDVHIPPGAIRVFTFMAMTRCSLRLPATPWLTNRKVRNGRSLRKYRWAPCRSAAI